MQRPVCIFVTFTTQEAKARVENNLFDLTHDEDEDGEDKNQTKGLVIFGIPLQF